jgi:U2-associated protein SR140
VPRFGVDISLLEIKLRHMPPSVIGLGIFLPFLRWLCSEYRLGAPSLFTTAHLHIHPRGFRINMPESSKIREFPDISNKLTAPSKKSVFERQKEEAEAKRQREEAETAAVYEDFVKSFQDDSGSTGSTTQRFSDNFAGGGPGFPSLKSGGGAKRHFAPSKVLKSGLGSLGPAPPSRKRPLDGSYPRQKDRGIFAFDDTPSTDARAAFQASDEEDGHNQSPEERAAPKPTLQLSSLPPGTSVPVIKALLPSSLTVDGVRIITLRGGSDSTERKSLSAIITLAKDTPASDIDTAVSSLQNRYLGLGFNLSISRHLSSALIGSAGVSSMPLVASSNSHPFGAQSIFSGSSHPLNRAPPPRGGFAPPPSYGGPAQSQYGRGPAANAPLQVPVRPPSDIKQLKLIHKTIEAVLTHGPEFEALLMSRPNVQKDEKWAWLWDARSTGGVWYRWRLWEVLSGGQDRISGRPQTVFEGEAQWRAPERKLLFEFTTEFEGIVTDEDFDSSDEDDSGDEAQRAPDADEEEGAKYLNPLQKAKLAHYLSRLPSTTARLRKGDVARVTAFAISHSGRGSDEVVQMLIDNVERPFAMSGANPDRSQANQNNDDSEGSESGTENKEKEKEDPSSAKLIALYLISDLLSSSSTSGVRHAWRYRQLFETALRFRSTFKRLGRLEREMGWGRLRAEKWRRAITQVLELWEGWCVFSSDAQDQLMADFIESAEDKADTQQLETEAKLQQDKIKKGAWKSVDKDETNTDVPKYIASAELDDMAMQEDLDGKVMLDEDENLDGEPMDEDLDGVPMSDSSEGDAMEEDETDVNATDSGIDKQSVVDTPGDESAKRAAEARKRRPRAVDMFADSDEE